MNIDSSVSFLHKSSIASSVSDLVSIDSLVSITVPAKETLLSMDLRSKETPPSMGDLSGKETLLSMCSLVALPFLLVGCRVFIHPLLIAVSRFYTTRFLLGVS